MLSTVACDKEVRQTNNFFIDLPLFYRRYKEISNKKVKKAQARAHKGLKRIEQSCFNREVGDPPTRNNVHIPGNFSEASYESMSLVFS